LGIGEKPKHVKQPVPPNLTNVTFQEGGKTKQAFFNPKTGERIKDIGEGIPKKDREKPNLTFKNFVHGDKEVSGFFDPKTGKLVRRVGTGKLIDKPNETDFGKLIDRDIQMPDGTLGTQQQVATRGEDGELHYEEVGVAVPSEPVTNGSGQSLQPQYRANAKFLVDQIYVELSKDPETAGGMKLVTDAQGNVQPVFEDAKKGAQVFEDVGLRLYQEQIKQGLLPPDYPLLSFAQAAKEAGGGVDVQAVEAVQQSQPVTNKKGVPEIGTAEAANALPVGARFTRSGRTFEQTATGFKESK